MKKSWIAALALAFVFAGAGVAFAQCPDPGNQFIVDTLADAAQIADGYNEPTCDLIINTTVNAAVTNLGVTAKSVVIQGPDVLDNNVRAGIVNAIAGGKIFLNAQNGNITMNEARVIASSVVQVSCDGAGCDIQISLSDVIASETLQFGGNGGVLQISAQDILNIQSSTVFGGAQVLITSKNGSVTWICVPGAGGCKDPLVSGVVSQLIDVNTQNTCAQQFAAQQPCTVQFLDSAALKAVCIQAPGVNCGGGRVELHITALLDIHIENSKIDSPGTFLIRSRSGRIFAAGAQLTAQKFEISADGDGVNFAMDFSGASLTTPGSIRMTANDCPAAATNVTCINLETIDIIAAAGTKKANFNGDNTVPLDPNVRDVAPGECAVAPVLNNANLTVVADNTTGIISLCGATVN
jgi:hypothetical protein